MDSWLTLRKDYCTLALLATEKDTKGHSFPTISLLTAQIVSYYTIQTYKVQEIHNQSYSYILKQKQNQTTTLHLKGCSLYRNSGWQCLDTAPGQLYHIWWFWPQLYGRQSIVWYFMTGNVYILGIYDRFMSWMSQWLTNLWQDTWEKVGEKDKASYMVFCGIPHMLLFAFYFQVLIWLTFAPMGDHHWECCCKPLEYTLPAVCAFWCCFMDQAWGGAMRGCSPNPSSRGVNAFQTAVLLPFNQYCGLQLWLGRVTESPYLPYLLGRDLLFHILYHSVTKMTLNQWLALSLVILLQWMGIRLMNLLIPSLWNVLMFLSHILPWVNREGASSHPLPPWTALWGLLLFRLSS